MLLEQNQKLGSWQHLAPRLCSWELEVPRGPPCNPEKSCYCPQFTDVETENSWGWGWGGAAQAESGVGSIPRSSASRVPVPAAGLLSTVQISYDVTVTVFLEYSALVMLRFSLILCINLLGNLVI